MTEETKDAAIPTPCRFEGDMAVLFTALAKAQAEYEQIEKSREVTVTPKKRQDGYQPPPYKFAYAPLAEVLKKTLPALNRNGLSFVQPLYHDGMGWLLKSILAHESGARIEVVTPIVLNQNEDSRQDLGKAVTYARRYSANGILGVVADEDDDGAAEGTENVQARQPGPRQGTQPTPPKPKPQEAKLPAEASVNARGQEQAKANAAAVAEEQRVKAESLEQQRKATEAGNAAAKAEADRKAREVEAERERILAENAKNLPAEQPDPEPVDDGKPLQDDTRKRLGAAFREAGFDNMTPEGREATTAFMVKVTGKASIKQMTDAEGRLLLLHVEGMKKSA